MIIGPLEQGRSLLELEGQLEERFVHGSGEAESSSGMDGSLVSVPELQKSCQPS